MNYQYMIGQAASAWELSEVTILLEFGAREFGETTEHVPWALFDSGYSVSRVRDRYWLGAPDGKILCVTPSRTRHELATLSRMARRCFSVV